MSTALVPASVTSPEHKRYFIVVVVAGGSILVLPHGVELILIASGGVCTVKVVSEIVSGPLISKSSSDSSWLL